VHCWIDGRTVPKRESSARNPCNVIAQLIADLLRQFPLTPCLIVLRALDRNVHGADDALEVVVLVDDDSVMRTVSDQHTRSLIARHGLMDAVQVSRHDLLGLAVQRDSRGVGHEKVGLRDEADGNAARSFREDHDGPDVSRDHLVEDVLYGIAGAACHHLLCGYHESSDVHDGWCCDLWSCVRCSVAERAEWLRLFRYRSEVGVCKNVSVEIYGIGAIAACERLISGVD